jgi:iron complex outermembrane receptor protein
MENINRGAFRACRFARSVFVAAIAFFAFAAVASEDESLVEEVIVTAALAGASDVGLSGNAIVLSGESIASSATAGLGGVLDDYLGMSVTDFGGAVSRPTIRGLTGDRVKVLLNGAQSRDVSGLGADHNYDIDLYNVDQIEIIKGPGSLLYANGAIGGIVNVVDSTIARTDIGETKAQLGLETQSVNDGQTEFIAVESNVAGFNFSASHKNAEFENFEIPNGAILHSEEEHDGEHEDEHEDEHEEELVGVLQNSDHASKKTRVGISKVQDWGYVGLSFATNESVYGVPFHGEGHEEHGEEGDEHEGERIFASTDSDVINFEGSFRPNNSFVKNINFYFRDTDYSLVEAHAEEAHDDEEEEEEGEHHEEGPTAFTNEAQEYGAIFDFSGAILMQKVAIEMVSEETAIVGEEAFMDPTESDELTLGYYASRDVGGFGMSFAIRNDWVDRKGSVSSEEEHGHDEDEHEEEEGHEEELEVQYFDTDSSATSVAFQIDRQINEQFFTTLNLASVEKTPATVELFMNGPHLATARYEVGNPSLDNERSNNMELTLDYEGGGFFGSVSLYNNDIDNYTYLQDETEAEHDEHEDDHGGLIQASYMQKNAEFSGYEFEIGTVIEVAQGDLTLSYGRDTVSAKFKNGGYVPRINPDRSLYKIAYERGSLDMNIVYKNVFSQRQASTTEGVTAGYDMLDLRATKVFELSDGLTLNVSVFGTNLLDEIARNHSSFVKNEVPLPGRSFGLKFNAEF